ncbi:peptidylprolyl isomerase [Ectothiorhodospira haloalkaliphila]|uniref:Periplasmic chaperone PpiD n=1 Tax=Ectothiorhodospira haloalkaliphila TaxID=421628 RepID=W8KFH6_9GAMM|nr:MULTISPECIES: SurA N-terminal domain-containing protein [Ectothiorhodospira]AHK78539.1 peptidylprolyl isomerase [Ectothiorhodospira haloalkaliphila]MCG5493229.1 SurA N-terminal domain-containing protein [Ectothiorhodospira variabilis]MCG5502558.1 SurA N-terminal domain-containing protein [Ectothiorhodospira variabilis]MCG5505676.1 SurA N-terminal domain-containing protein [Ectothiorhodospira variabilis]MCG5525401.1 SurA N-terminal domain-containing protein [Ectothiorhodospira haloalkaliphil
MLLKIRDKASGWFAYAIIIMITIPFALWGVHEYFGGGARLVAAEVNGTEITTRELQREVQRQRDQMAQFFGGRLPDGVLDEQALREHALQSVIRRELVRQIVSERGFTISQQAVARELSGIEVFHQNGVFDPERYQRLLEAQRISRGAFEADVAQGLRLEQFEAGVRNSALVTDAEVREYLRLSNQERTLSYFIIPAEDYAREVNIDDDQVQAYYAQNEERFRTPERVRLSYVELDLGRLESELSVSESELRRHYRQELDRFTSPEERRAAHILVRVPRDADDAQVEALRSKARELRARIDEGEDFESVAREASEDDFSAGDGGDLGYLQRGDLGSALDGVLFTMDEGEISQPVRTNEGFHILRLTEIQPAESEPFEAVRDEVEQEVRARQVESRQIELIEQMITQAYENPRSLAAVADATGLEVRETDWLTRDEGEGIGEQDAVRRAAFSTPVLQEERNSDLLELADGRALVIRVKEHEPSTPRPLEEVEDQIRELIRAEESARLAREAGEVLLQALREGESLSQVTQGLPGELDENRTVTREDARVPNEILRTAFGLSAPREGRHTAGGVSLEDGDYALLTLQEVRNVEPDQRALSGARGHLRGLYGALDFEAVLESLQAQADIKIHRDNL